MKDELCYIHGEPFRWDEVRLAQLRAELDAYYGKSNGKISILQTPCLS